MFDRETTERYQRSLGLAIILALVFFFWGNQLARGVANLISYLTAPLVYTNGRVIEEGRLTRLLLRPKIDLARENLVLRDRVNFLEARLVAGSVTPVIKMGSATSTSARLVSRPGLFPYDYLLIEFSDRAATKRVKPGSLVTAGPVALGRVVTVYQTLAKVRLFSAPGTELAVTIGTTSPATPAKGLSGGSFLVTLPRAVNIASGAVVTGSGLPPGLILGPVGYVDKNPSIPFQQIIFRYPLNFYELKMVEVRYD